MQAPSVAGSGSHGKPCARHTNLYYLAIADAFARASGTRAGAERLGQGLALLATTRQRAAHSLMVSSESGRTPRAKARLEHFVVHQA